jgi:hypothetical protein
MSVAARQLSLAKEGQRFVFRYCLGCESELLSCFVEMANDPESDFDWFDAAVLSYQMGQQLTRQRSAGSPLELGHT